MPLAQSFLICFITNFLASKILKIVTRVSSSTNNEERRNFVSSQSAMFQDPKVQELHLNFCNYIDFDITRNFPEGPLYPQLEDEDTSSAIKDILRCYRDRQKDK